MRNIVKHRTLQINVFIYSAENENALENSKSCNEIGSQQKLSRKAVVHSMHFLVEYTSQKEFPSKLQSDVGHFINSALDAYYFSRLMMLSPYKCIEMNIIAISMSQAFFAHFLVRF